MKFNWLGVLSNLDHPDPIVRGRAAESLGASGEKQSIDYLRRLVSDPDSMVRFKAALELAWMKDDTGVSHLLQALHTKDLCFMALDALCELGSEKALSGLERFFSRWGLHPLERLLAAAALHRLGDARGSDYLAGKLQSVHVEERGFALELWGRLNMPGAFELLIDVASNPDSEHRLDAVRGLAWLQDARSLPVLEALRQNGDDELLADLAAQTIRELGSFEQSDTTGQMEG